MSTPDPVDRALARADRHVARGQDRRALAILEPLLAAHPGREADIQVALVGAHAAAGRRKQALAAGRRAVALAPDSAVAHDALGRALRASRRRGDAVTAFDRAVALDPSWAAAHTHRSLALTDLRRIGDARAAAEEAIRLAPGDADAHFALGYALNDSHPRDALRAYEAALARAPGHAAAVHALSALRLNAADAGLAQRYGVADGLAKDPGRRAGVAALDQRIVDRLGGLQLLAFGCVLALVVVTVVAARLDAWARGLGLGVLVAVAATLGASVVWFVRARLLPVAREAPGEGPGYWRSFARRERLATAWLGCVAVALLTLVLGVTTTLVAGLGATPAGVGLMWGSLFMAALLLVAGLILGLVRRACGLPRHSRPG